MTFNTPRTLALLMLALAGCTRDRATSALPRESAEFGQITLGTDTASSCDTCALAFHLLASYGTSDDQYILRKLPRLVRTQQGRLLAYVPHDIRHEVVMYDKAGRTTWIGGFGRGPGEYESVSGVTVQGDSIFVAHDGIHISVFHGDGTFLASTQSEPIVTGGILAPSSRTLLVVGETRSALTRRRAAAPIHLIDLQRGKLLSSLRSDPVMITGGADWVLAKARSNSVWFAERAGNYRIQRAALDGKVLQSIIRKTPHEWFVGSYISRTSLDSMLAADGSRDVTDLLLSRPRFRPIPPAARVTGLYESRGVLWVSITVAAPNWRESPLDYSGDALDPTEESVSKLYQTKIEAVDANSGRLLARGVVEGIGMILNDGTVGRTYYDVSGLVRVDLLQPVFYHTSNGEDS